jgi:hypothetical protein
VQAPYATTGDGRPHPSADQSEASQRSPGTQGSPAGSLGNVEESNLPPGLRASWHWGCQINKGTTALFAVDMQPSGTGAHVGLQIPLM